MSQQYCLRWNNHQHNLLSVFEDLLHHEAFVDVTLACDGLQLKAHKMVLSACSPYFQSMLYGTPDRHPIVFLRDVRYHEMKALLEFMYRGEVSVDQDNLTSLLKVAEGLKIKGLADVNEQKQQQQAQAAMAGLLTLQQSPAHPLFPGMMSPSNNSKRPASPNPPPNPNSSSQQQNPNYLGPKRKRGRPRRLSGSEAVPLASGLVDNTTNDELHVQTEDMNTKVKEEKVNTINVFFYYYYWLSLTRKCQKISSKDSFINYKLFFCNYRVVCEMAVAMCPQRTLKLQTLCLKLIAMMDLLQV